MEKMNEKNPFKIMEGVKLDEVSKGGKDMEKTGFLIEDMLALPIDKNKSLTLPNTFYTSKSQASAAVAHAKCKIQETYPQLKDCAFTVRSFFDAEKKYVCVRVWRIN